MNFDISLNEINREHAGRACLYAMHSDLSLLIVFTHRCLQKSLVTKKSTITASLISPSSLILGGNVFKNLIGIVNDIIDNDDDNKNNISNNENDIWKKKSRGLG